jgi:putative membrane protein
MTNNRKPAAFDIKTNSKKPSDKPSKRKINSGPRPAKSIDIENKNLQIASEEDDIFAAQLNTLDEMSEHEPPVKLKKSKFSILRLAAAAIVMLLSLSFGLWAETLITDLFERSPLTGWLGASALLVLLVSFLFLIVREIIGIAKLRSVEKLRKDIEKALPTPNIPQARDLVSRITKIVIERPETARGRQILLEAEDDIIDGNNLLALAETQLLGNLDKEARKLILSSAKRVSVVTAISPKALIDTGYALYEMVRLTRKLANLYGSHPGFFGILKLLRSVISHLAVTGTVAIGESLIHQFVSHGIAGKISARFGEGVINGIMTTRFGIVAMELSRPMPFKELKRPQIKSFLSELTTTSPPKDVEK